MLLLKVCHERLDVWRHRQFGMHRGEEQNMGANFAVPGVLVFDLAVRGQESHKIDEHQLSPFRQWHPAHKRAAGIFESMNKASFSSVVDTP